jgi:hypothetical protein
MADFNDNTNLYPTTSAAGDLNLYLYQTFGLAADEGLIQNVDTCAIPWGIVGQPDPTISPSANVSADNCSEYHDHHLVSLAVFNPLPSDYATPSATQPEEYSQHLYPNQHWSESQEKIQPETDYAEPLYSEQYLPEFHAQPRPASRGGPPHSGQGWPQFQPDGYKDIPLPVQHRPEVHPAGFSDGDVSFPDAVPPETSNIISASSSGEHFLCFTLINAHQERTDPLSHSGDSRGGSTIDHLHAAPTDPSRQQSVQTDYDPSPGRAKTNLERKRRPQPYGTYDTRASKHVKAVAGPSVVAHTPSVDSPTIQSSEKVSGVIADALDELAAEVAKGAPVSNFYRSHIPRVSD